MRTVTTFILLSIAITSWGQPDQTKSDRFLAPDQNENWLTTTKSFDKWRQWTAIKQRFFLAVNCNIPTDSIQYSPMIIINGVLLNIPIMLTDKDSRRVLRLLHEDAIEQIDILDKLSEEWIFCKPFSGVIILAVDKKSAMKLFKLNWIGNKVRNGKV
jgi:hypothetical protein